MTIIAAIADSPEGRAALRAGAAEARALDQTLVIVNLALHALDPELVPRDIESIVVDRHGRDDRDPVKAILDVVEAHDASRVVIGLKRRSAVGKALLGSVSQRLLLDCPVPVLAVKS